MKEQEAIAKHKKISKKKAEKGKGKKVSRFTLMN